MWHGVWHQRADEMLGDTPPRCNQVPLVVKSKDGRLPRGLLALHCFCICGVSALLGGLRSGASRSVECEFVRPVFILGFFVHVCSA